MPGYAAWRQLCEEEIFQLREEGYDVSSVEDIQPADDSERGWEELYHRIWQIHDTPLRADFPYTEPNSLAEIFDAAAAVPALIPLTPEQYREQLYGAWYGRLAGVVLGKPLEMGMDAVAVRKYLEGADAWPLTDYVPERSAGSGMTARGDCIVSTKGNIRYVQPDDDVHYTLLALLLAERYGTDFTPAQVGENWLNNIPYHWFWCASRQAYYHMINGLPPEKIPLTINPWRECIDGQIRSDLWGYIAPGCPREAAVGAWRDCSFSLVKNGVYGGMFVAGAISAALSHQPDVSTILQGGLSVIPRGSRFAEMVCLVADWYGRDRDWEPTCRRIYDRWGHLPFAATINNMAMVVLSLLHGNLDYEKTITTAICCGLDTDCNGGTAGSIVGAAVGLSGIEERWYTPFQDTIHSVVADVGQTSIDKVAERIYQLGMTKWRHG